jgi:hypothetical protein
MICPSNNATIELDLDRKCGNDMAEKYTLIKSNFDKLCIANNTCELDLSDEYFSPDCLKKIGTRYNIINNKVNAQKAIDDGIGADGVQIFMVVSCNSTDVNLKNGFIPYNDEEIKNASKIGRENIGLIVVIFDLIIMICFLIYVWVVSYYVRVDANRHKN